MPVYNSIHAGLAIDDAITRVLTAKDDGGIVSQNILTTALNPYLLSATAANTYAPLTGTGANGTWGISISGSAGSVAWSNVGSKPETATRWPAWSEVTSKPETATRWPAWSEVTSKPETATRWPTWSEVTSKPSSFTPTSHTHAWGDVTGKPSTYAPSSHSHTSLACIGSVAQETGRTSARGGVYSYRMYNVSGAPATYLAVIGFGMGTGGHGEIAGYWCSSSGLWYRSLRDTTDNWFGWLGITQATSSSIYIKENIENITNAEAKKILNLRPVHFDYLEKYGNKDQYGFIAEEVDETLPCMVVNHQWDTPEITEEYDGEPVPMQLEFHRIIPHMVKMIQIQDAEIQSLKERITALEN